ncbi:hypothetical protein D9611_001006 [Ephemerocybe angulata]|uniref:G domain-containing protein n=1 Tax=Ephemerocybe angulata TaxID=980116 RepID=A0A8H5BMS9_9AGAR|nr:hypothetical protein D9611_001006 [Tulosesus angulatus]
MQLETNDQVPVVSPAPVRHNIVVFGESGTGKSSIVNMLCGHDQAPVAGAAVGCTLESKGYEGEINGQPYMFWDTCGLNEGEGGKIPDMKAAAALYHLLCNLEDGVSLLVFCMRGPRITEIKYSNWELFREVICQKEVPTVLAVTHLEQEELDGWWSENQAAFKRAKIRPDKARHREFQQEEWDEIHSDPGVACITATKGKVKRNQYLYQEEYDASCAKIRKLVFEAHLPEPWKLERVEWFQRVTREVKTGCWPWSKSVEEHSYLPGDGVYALMRRWGIKDKQEASRLARILEGAYRNEGSG